MNCKWCGRKATKIKTTEIRTGAGTKIVKEHTCDKHSGEKLSDIVDVYKIRRQEYGFSD